MSMTMPRGLSPDGSPCPSGEPSYEYDWNAPGDLSLYVTGGVPPAGTFDGQRIVQARGRLTGWKISQAQSSGPPAPNNLSVRLYCIRQGVPTLLGTLTLDQTTFVTYGVASQNLSYNVMPGDILTTTLTSVPNPGPPLPLDMTAQVFIEP